MDKIFWEREPCPRWSKDPAVDTPRALYQTMEVVLPQNTPTEHALVSFRWLVDPFSTTLEPPVGRPALTCDPYLPDRRRAVLVLVPGPRTLISLVPRPAFSPGQLLRFERHTIVTATDPIEPFDPMDHLGSQLVITYQEYFWR